MKNSLAKIQFPLLTFLGAAALLFYFYHEVVLHPNDFLFSAEGDGIKNYYTYLFHAKYDASFHQFGGMNYPFYEHVVYTDGHPLLAYLIGKLGLTPYGVGILNSLILWSYPIAAIILFSIFKHFKVNNWWALGASIAITFLSPQVFRMTGHFSMSYVFAVPLMWWFLIQCSKENYKISWSIVSSLYLIAFFFTHPYLGMILIAFTVAYWFIRMIADKTWIKRGLLHIFLQVIIPIGTFQGYVFFTDTHSDRLSNPAGFFHYYASWKSLLVAHDGPLKSIYSRLAINIGNWESWSYLGFPTLLFFTIWGIYIIRNRKLIAFKPFFKSETFYFLLAAHIILLFAFCFPLKYSWMRWLADLLGPIKQFRILGRFTWIFFYVATVLCIVAFYRLAMKEKKWIYSVIFAGGLIFYFLEFAPPHHHVSNYISNGKNMFKSQELDPDLKELVDFVKSNEYDAVIFLPMQHMSSENLMMLGAEESNKDAFLLSYHANIPLVNSISSRMSLTESIKVNNYFSPAFMEKELTYDFPKNAKIAVIKSHSLLDIFELRMIWESEQVMQNEKYWVFDFDPEKWNDSSAFEQVLANNQKANISLKQGWRSDTNDVWFYYNGFDEHTTTTPVLGGSGALKDSKNGYNTIDQFSFNSTKAEKYEASFWYYLRADRPDVDAVVEASYKDTANQWLASTKVSESTVIVNEWCRVSLEFETDENITDLHILITGNGNGQPFIVDELLVRKLGDPPLFQTRTENGIEYVNYYNYWLKKNAFNQPKAN